MKRTLILTALLLTCLALPARAQIQYFGYVTDTYDFASINQTKGFTNFAHLAASVNLNDDILRLHVNSLVQNGLKVTLNLGVVFWCQDAQGYYKALCPDWAQRWALFMLNNADILTPSKIIAMDVLDEPMLRQANMAQYEMAVQAVKTAYPWVKVYMAEGACAIENTCPMPSGYNSYFGNLPGVDWLAVDKYGIHPATDVEYRNAVTHIKQRFPGRKMIYIMDGYYGPTQFGLGDVHAMGAIAREWYDVARADPDTILLGVLGWDPFGEGQTSRDFPCDVLAQHVSIGRAITGKPPHAQTAQPVGSFTSISSNGLATGWACDPDGLLCEQPRLDYYVNGIYGGAVAFSDSRSQLGQCGVTGLAYNFQQYLPYASRATAITVYAHDLDTGNAVLLPSACANNPACTWYTNYFQPKGYMENLPYTGIASGWVCDPDAPLVSSKVRLTTANGAQIGIYTTNLGSEPAVASECGGGTLHRFSVQLPPWVQGQRVYAFAEDLMSGEVQIPWLCDDGWSCSW